MFQYNGVSARTLTFNLRVAALARQDMYWMWKKINKLVGMCYPSKYEKGKYMTSPMMELTLGDYMVSQPGFLNSLNIQVADDYPWEINLEGDKNPNLTFGGLSANSLADVGNSLTTLMNDPLGTAANILTDVFIGV